MSDEAVKVQIEKHGFTNRHGFPEWYNDLYWAFNYDATDGGKRKSDLSATGIIKPTQIIVLLDRYGHLVVEDIADQTWRLLGSAAHSAMYWMQRRSIKRMEEEGLAPRVKPVLEERMYTAIVTPEGEMMSMSGAPDRICVDGVVRDFKFTSAWTHVFRSRDKEWRRQLAIYNWLGYMYGLDVANKGEICAIFRDWHEKNLINEKYPIHDVGFYEFDLPSPQATAQWVSQKVGIVIEAKKMADDELPQCQVGGPDDEVWVSGEKWAYYNSEAETKATRLYNSESEAVARMESDGLEDQGAHIVHRQGARKRCEGYCSVAPWCQQYLAWCKETGKTPVTNPGMEVAE